MQSYFYQPTESCVYEKSAWQAVFDPVRKPRPASHILEFVPVDPLRERSAYLLVHEEPVPLARPMQCDPGKKAYAHYRSVDNDILCEGCHIFSLTVDSLCV